MPMTPTEEAEWQRKYGNASTATGAPAAQGNGGAGTVDSQTNWWSTYNPAEGASQAGGGRWADNQYNWDQDRMNRVATERNAYQGQVDQSRGYQDQSLGLLRDAAMGNAPSRAELLSRHQMDQAASAQQSLAASARGPAALAMAQQQAAGNTARSMADISANTSAMRADEMARARDAYFGGTSTMRGQDQQRVDAASQRELGYMGNQLGWGQLDQQGRAQDARLGLDAFGANQSSEAAWNARKKADEERRQAKADGAVKAVGSGIATAAMFASDVRAKENIQPVPSQAMEQYLATLQPASYTYNGAVPGTLGTGQQVGPASAQNIAATQVGQSVIEQRPDGMLAISAPGAIKAGMAADAHINDKASRAEAKADAALKMQANQHADPMTAALMGMGGGKKASAPRSLASLTAAPTVVTANPKTDWLAQQLASINATNSVKGPR